MARFDPTAYAQALAHLQHFPKDQRMAVLERLGCSAADLSDAAVEHGDALAASAASDGALVAIFQAELASTKRRLADESPRVEDVRPLVEESDDPDTTHPVLSSKARRPALPFVRATVAVVPAAHPLAERDATDATYAGTLPEASAPALPWTNRPEKGGR